MHGSALDLRGKKFGKLTAIEALAERKSRSIVWLCRCDCGNMAKVTASRLKSGGTKSCGCLLLGKDITGMVSGKLTALERVGRDGRGQMWLCQCECGNTTIVSKERITGRYTLSCGCQSSRKVYGSLRHREKAFAEKFNAKYPDLWVYDSGYTGYENDVNIKCLVCGEIQPRHAHKLIDKDVPPRCDACDLRRREFVDSLLSEIKSLRAREKYLSREIQRLEREIEERNRPPRKLKCAECGEAFYTKTMYDLKYCSKKCRHRANKRKSKARRLMRTTGKSADPSISLDRVYERDKGICYICGHKTDYNDHSHKNGHFCSGPAYPTIDHVFPISKGGSHQWGNVKLACHRCNSLKSDNVKEVTHGRTKTTN
jgi:hypothetical protein